MVCRFSVPLIALRIVHRLGGRSDAPAAKTNIMGQGEAKLNGRTSKLDISGARAIAQQVGRLPYLTRPTGV